MQMDPGSRLQGTGDAFVVDRVQGEGGFGITYRCHRERDGLPVIAKVLRMERLGEWKSLELFEREAQVLRQLEHDLIPDYIDFFSQGDPAAPAGLVLVQELVEGSSLAAGMKEGRRLDEEAMLGWFVQILEVLAYLHSLSPPVIHRDVTPKNIILRDDGKAFLVDFGTVQAAVLSASTLASTSAGTFGYAPPEQFMGRATPASDLYALAMTYLAVATGGEPEHLPLDGIRVAVRATGVQHHARIMLLLEAMTEPDPKERLGDAREALRRLQPLVEARQVREAAQPQPGAPQDASRDASASSEPGAHEPAAGPSTTATKDPSPATERAAKERLRPPKEPASKPEGQPGPFTRATWIEAERRLATIAAPWTRSDLPHLEEMRGAALSHDGKRLVIEGAEGRFELQTEGDRPRARPLVAGDSPEDIRSAGGPDFRRRVASPDGVLVAEAKGNAIKVRERNQRSGGEPLQADTSRGLFFSPDGTELVALGERKVVFFGKDGTARREQATAFDYRPDGRLSVIARGSELRFEPSGTELRLGDTVNGLRFSPDGLRLAALVAESLVVIELSGDGTPGARRDLPAGRNPRLALLGFNHDASRLVAFGQMKPPGLPERPAGVHLWSIRGGSYLGSLHIRKNAAQLVFVTPRRFWEPFTDEGLDEASPWRALGVARRSFVEGRTDEELLDAPARAALEDLELRGRALSAIFPKKGGLVERLIADTAGLTHLLPHVLDEARRLVQPKFGKPAGDPSGDEVAAACKALRGRSPEERQVLFEEMLCRLEVEEARAAERKAEEEAERKARDESDKRARELAGRREKLEAEREKREDAAREARNAERRLAGDADQRIEEKAEWRARDEAARKARAELAAQTADAEGAASTGAVDAEGEAGSGATATPTTPRRLHRGHIWPGFFVALTLGLAVFGAMTVGSKVDAYEVAGVFSLIIGGLFLLGLVVFAFHGRCPKCRGLFTRKVLSKTYSHTATEQETTYEHGTPHTRTVHRRIYSGTFRCHRCGHHWSGYM